MVLPAIALTDKDSQQDGVLWDLHIKLTSVG
jgi:hypothetical protein